MPETPQLRQDGARGLAWNPSRLTWRCDICREERPDDKIDVAYRPLRGQEHRFPDVRFNLKFCVDRVDCKARAHGPGPWPENERSSI